MLKRQFHSQILHIANTRATTADPFSEPQPTRHLNRTFTRQLNQASLVKLDIQ